MLRRFRLIQQTGLGRAIDLPPTVILIALHLILITVGTLLLQLPIARTAPLSWIDALFTATSAVTVTGHVVVDTGSHFTLFGQVVIAILIQFGGLGLMTFAVVVLSALGLPISFQQQEILKEDLNQTSIRNLLRFARIVLQIMIICEMFGMAALAPIFVPELGWGLGLWHALFHVISAFNNAGFALYPDSFSRWATSPLVNLSVPLLFIIGGIGFAVIADVIRLRSWRRYSLHSKLMLSGTAALILVSVTTFAILEWHNPATLGGLAHIHEKLMVSWFQGVTTRTAGFNTVPIDQIQESTAVLFIGLMLVGAGSTSTAGGIKVTTFIVLLLAIVAFFKRRPTLYAFGRSLGLDQLLKVMALTTISILFIFTGLFICLLTYEGDFLDLAFDLVSAFGTVGLARGTLGEFNDLNKLMVMILMFVGRVGPLTLGFFLATRRTSTVRYPSAQVYLG